jgi:hypothetical protein
VWYLSATITLSKFCSIRQIQEHAIVLCSFVEGRRRLLDITSWSSNFGCATVIVRDFPILEDWFRATAAGGFQKFVTFVAQ